MIAVAHLVWGPLGIAWPRRFLDSYRRHGAGIDHELVLLLNGVDEQLRSEIAQEFQGVEYRLVDLNEPVQDIAAYAEAVKRIEHEYVCFLNSYSTILAPDWLVKLKHALDKPGAGLVGATGSWASVYSAVLNSLFLPNPYRGVIPKRSVIRQEMQAIDIELKQRRVLTDEAQIEIQSARRNLLNSVVSTLKSFGQMPAQLSRFQPFPAYHLRTNGFMAKRAMLAELQMHEASSKMEAYVLESGRNSITRQVGALGLKALVVDRDGETYERERWDLSLTFCQGEQERLLIADNQTRIYSDGGYDRRRVLSSYAWGPNADPASGGSHGN